MNLDDLDGLSQVPSRARKFAPGRPGKSKPKPKPEQKQEPVESPEHTEQVNASALGESECEVSVKVGNALPKMESAVAIGAAIKMEVDSKTENEFKTEKEPGTMPSVPMDEDRQEQQTAEEEEEEEEEEDAVVREIDVYFNPSSDADTKLYVLQYPLRPSWRPYELDERCEEVRVKPATTEVEVDLSMDVHSKNYDKEIGERLKMTKQTLSTSWKPSQATDYSVGVLIGDKLHLNPVHAIVQLRPSMQYLSSTGKKKHIIAKSPDEFSGPSKKQNKGMESSSEQKTIDEESWTPLKYHGFQSDVSSRYLQKMMAKEKSSIDFTMNLNTYINSLCPGGMSRNLIPNGPSRRIMLSMPLDERIKKLLCEGPPCRRFSVLKHYCRDDSNEDVLRVLQQHAFLVQGIWTPKTGLLNLDGAMSLARDYVLVLFSKDPIIKSAQVDVAGRNRDRVKEILKTLAIERPLLNDWKFKEPTDVSFIKHFPEIVKLQEEALKTMEKRVMSVIESIRPRTDGRKNVRTKPDAAVKSEKPLDSDKGATRNVRVSSARRTMSEETRKALPKALKKVFQTHKVCSFQLICQGLRDLAISKANNPKAHSSMEVVAAFGVDAPPEELQEVISQVATNIHGYYVLTSSPDHPEYDPLRKVVIDLLCGSGHDAKLKKAEVFEAGRSVLGREITANEYIKVMGDLCESKGSAWVLRKST